MSTINIVAHITDVHFDQLGDGGENAVFTLKTPVVGKGNRELFGGLASATEQWNIALRRRADYEEEVSVGYVSGFNEDRLTFLMPASKAGATGMPKGAFVVTNGGIVAAIVGAQAQAGDLARRLIEVGGLFTERIMGEQPAVDYSAVMVGGMVTTPHGMAYYYRPPVFPPSILEDVHTTPQGAFFWIDERNPQATHLIARLANLVGDKRIDAYLAGSILHNAAAMAGANSEEYRDAVLQTILDYDRVTAVQEAFDALPDLKGNHNGR